MDEETTVHWHGLAVDGASDGGPHDVIEPKQSVTTSFTVDQPAATLWFHPQPKGKTAKQVYEGLAGLFIVEDDETDALHLPSDYGKNDIPLIIQDKSFDRNGQFTYDPSMHDEMMGLTGETMLVNGVISPYVEVEQGLMRFRLLNGSNARVFDLSLSNNDDLNQIASDGGLLAETLQMKTLRLGPAERGEVIIGFSNKEMGETISLLNEGDEIMTFVVANKQEETLVLPKQLRETLDVVTDEDTIVRQFSLKSRMHNFTINDQSFDIDRIDHVTSLNTTEIWEVTNDDGSGMMGGMIHPFHIHGTQFHLLDRDGKAPPLNERGLKDTVIVYPGETVRLAVTFNHPGLFMYHCHILEHEEGGMMGQIDVSF